jgi:ABC-type nitrate/sulfonate/bicarbonate transport system ATPase subunit
MAEVNAISINVRRKEFRSRGKSPAHLAISGLSFDVSTREFVCLLGPSGCGKTTLLNLIAGLDRDYDGDISIHQAPGRRLAYLFQTPRLLPWRTVLENVTLSAGEEARSLEVARALLAKVGLHSFENAFPGQISVGMQRRVALARAFAFSPGVLLMDEPFVSLDEPSADKLRMLLSTLWRENPTTVLFVTHDVREAIRLAERLVILSGAPAQVVHDVPVSLSSSERMDPAAVEAFRSEVLGGVKDTLFLAHSDELDGNGC